MINLLFNNSISYFKYIIFLFMFWLSINTGSKYINLAFTDQNFDIYNINLLRSLLPYFFILFYFLSLKKYQKNFISNTDVVLNLFLVYAILQILGMLYYLDNMYDHYWAICLISLIFFFNWINHAQDEKLLNFIFLINKIALILIFTIFITIAIKDNFFSKELLYHSQTMKSVFNGEHTPRSSGLSRMGLVIFIFFNSFYFANVHKKLFCFSILIINIIVISIFLLLQSRGVILSFVLIFILINFIYKFNGIKHRCAYFLLIVIIPIILSTIYQNTKNYGKKEITIKLELRENVFGAKNTSEDFNNKLISFSNNRMIAWDFLLQVFFYGNINHNMKKKVKSQGYDVSSFKFKNKKNLLTGYGPQADRHFMYNNTNSSESNIIMGPFGYHASNGYIYSLISSGIIGFLVFITLNFIIFFKIVKIIFKHQIQYLNTKPYLTASILCIIFLHIRLLYENSFAIYGVDLFILLSSYLIIQREFKKIIN